MLIYLQRITIGCLHFMVTWSLAVFLAGSNLHGEGEGNVTAGPLVEMQVNAPDGSLAIDDQWILPLTIRNVGQKSVDVQQVGWEVPMRLAHTRVPPPSRKPTAPVLPAAASATQLILNVTHPEWYAGNQLGSEGVKHLPHSQDSLPCRLVMPAIASTGWDILFNSNLLFWRSEEVPVTIYVVCGGESGTITLRQTIKVRFTPSPWAMVYGGLAGSILAMLFYFTYRAGAFVKRWAEGQRAESGELPDPKAADQRVTKIDFRSGLTTTLQVEGIFSLFRTITGMVTVIIVLLFLSTGNTAALPISITVNDFLGAAFMGLFSHKLGEWVFDSLFGATPIPGTKTEKDHADEERAESSSSQSSSSSSSL